MRARNRIITRSSRRLLRSPRLAASSTRGAGRPGTRDGACDEARDEARAKARDGARGDTRPSFDGRASAFPFLGTVPF
jgi:hypothetical protein